MSLTLIYEAITIVIPTFVSATRDTPQWLSRASSAVGTAIVTGEIYESAVWTGTAIADEKTKIKFALLARLSREEATLTPPYTGFSIRLHDTNERIGEQVRTRAFVPGTSVETDVDGIIYYYPQYNVVVSAFNADENYGQKNFQISYQLQELDKVPV